MCLSTEAFALFLSLLGPEIVTSEPDRITIHATEQDVLWMRRDEGWCTNAAPAHMR